MLPSLLRLKNLAPLALAFIALSAQAGTRDTGGGTGIMMGSRLVLLDLVEAGLDQSATIPAITADPSIRAQLMVSLKLPEPMKSQVLEPLAKKLTDIEQGGGKSTGMLMAAAFSFYTFHPVTLKLTAVDDVDSAIGESRLQLAVRKGPAIYLSTPYWEQLDEVNRVALLMHEIIYAFQPLPTGCSEVSAGIFGGTREDCANSAIDSVLATSAKARYMNAYFFRANWRRTWIKELTPEMSANDDNSVYSSLFHSMHDEADTYGFRGRIGAMRASGTPDVFGEQDNELYPVYASINVNGKGGIKLITRTTPTSTLTSICAGDEYPEPVSGFFQSGNDADKWETAKAKSLQSSGGPSLQESSTGLKFELDVVTVDGDVNALYLQSLPEFRAKCVAELKEFQKKMQ